MHTIHRISALLLAAALAACTEQSLPQFQNPQPISVPSGKPAYGPRLSLGSDESLILSWMEYNDDVGLLKYSTFDNGSWQDATIAATDNDMFVNWADLPAVVPLGNDVLLAQWLSYVGDAPYAYQVLTRFSADGGATWGQPGSPHTDGTETEHGFVSHYPTGTGVGLVWLDGRETPEQGMTLRSARLETDGSLHDESVIDDLVCDCCQTDIAVTSKGPVAIYRNRTSDEVRDHYVSRYIDGSWQPGVQLADDGWVIAGCPVNGPSIDALGDLVVVAWFTAADNKPRVRTAFSKNAGKSFSAPVEVAARGSLGHVGVSVIDRHSYVVSWMDADKDNTYEVNLRGLTLDGQKGRAITAGRTSLRSTTPQLVRTGDTLILAWTDEISDDSKVVSVEMPILGFYD